MSLADKIAESRKLTAEVGDIKLYFRRATVEEYVKYCDTGITNAEVARYHITGWDGVKESDIVDGGSNEKIPFDKKIFCDIIGDRPEWYSAIILNIADYAKKRIQEMSANEKK